MTISICQQSDISQANQAVGGLKLALQNKQGEIENLLSREQQADSALRSKEAELTQTTDQLLRVSYVHYIVCYTNLNVSDACTVT